jgi:hypothetical protein
LQRMCKEVFREKILFWPHPFPQIEFPNVEAILAEISLRPFSA